MPRVTMHRSFDAPRSLVWAVVTDPQVYGEVAPNLRSVEILEGAGEGMVRRCVDTDGNAWTETCDRWEAGREFAVEVDVANSEFHRRFFTRFAGAWRLERRAGAVLATIQFDFEPRYGPLGWLVAKYFERKARPLVEAIFDGWDGELDARLAEADRPSDGDGRIESIAGRPPEDQ